MSAMGDMTAKRRLWVAAVIIALLALFPLLVYLLDQPFYQDVVNRMMILAMAAITLNLILGHGGMVSFGHAAYIGIGAYCVGIPAYYGVYSGILQFSLSMLAAGFFALITGAICLRMLGL